MLSHFLTFPSCFASGSPITASSCSGPPCSSISINWEVKRREGRRMWLEEVSSVFARLIFRFYPQNNNRRDTTRQMDELWYQPLWQGFPARQRCRDRQEQYISEAWGHASMLCLLWQVERWKSGTKSGLDFYHKKPYIYTEQPGCY